MFYYTSSDPVFSEETPYDALHVYAYLHHDGDLAAADRAAEAATADTAPTSPNKNAPPNPLN